jgi:hypothetical protein
VTRIVVYSYSYVRPAPASCTVCRRADATPRPAGTSSGDRPPPRTCDMGDWALFFTVYGGSTTCHIASRCINARARDRDTRREGCRARPRVVRAAGAARARRTRVCRDGVILIAAAITPHDSKHGEFAREYNCELSCGCVAVVCLRPSARGDIWRDRRGPTRGDRTGAGSGSRVTSRGRISA